MGYTWKTDSFPCLSNDDGTYSIPAHIFWLSIVSVMLVVIPSILFVSSGGIHACVSYFAIMIIFVILFCIAMVEPPYF